MALSLFGGRKEGEDGRRWPVSVRLTAKGTFAYSFAPMPTDPAPFALLLAAFAGLLSVLAATVSTVSIVRSRGQRTTHLERQMSLGLANLAARVEAQAAKQTAKEAELDARMDAAASAYRSLTEEAGDSFERARERLEALLERSA